MVNFALDSNAYSDFMRVRGARKLFLPLIVLAVLRAGFAAVNQQATNQANLQRFINSDRVSVLSPDDQTTYHDARLCVTLRDKGSALPTNDLWIAALVVQHGLVLCTSDAHFRYLPALVTC